MEEVEFPDLPYEAILRMILDAESASFFEEFADSGRASMLTSPEDRYGPYARMVVLAKDYLRALRLRGVMARGVAEAMSRVDLIVAPARNTCAPPIDKKFRGSFKNTRDVVSTAGNGAGLPAVAVPNGFTGGGLPTGIQFMGKPREENMVLAAAQLYQAKTDWHTKHPPIG